MNTTSPDTINPTETHPRECGTTGLIDYIRHSPPAQRKARMVLACRIIRERNGERALPYFKRNF